MMNRFIAHNMPKIELHCHLDGSVSLPLIQKLMQQEKKEPLGLEELRKKLVAPMDCSSLAEYLEKFELPLGCLQTKEGLSAAAHDQGTLHKAVKPCSRIPGAEHEAADS